MLKSAVYRTATLYGCFLRLDWALVAKVKKAIQVPETNILHRLDGGASRSLCHTKQGLVNVAHIIYLMLRFPLFFPFPFLPPPGGARRATIAEQGLQRSSVRIYTDREGMAADGRFKIHSAQ